ncbi:MAG: phage major capsid protein [Oscillospiraceae bacterium]|nr:phage major capsid protein [Oscillospiraceae bacterium]MBQ1610462.1 phage major capsid protein [Muribaculaceae bacterium]
MKSLVTLNAELDELRAKADAILENGQAEERKLSEDEEQNFNDLIAAIDEKKAEIKDAEERTIINPKPQPKMEETKKFSLLRAIRSVVNKEQFDETASAVINAGNEQMRAAGLSTQGDIVIPTAETRATVSVTNTTGATVPVDVAPIFDELRAESVLEKAGATYYTGLVGDLKVPMMTAASVAWAGENAAASDAAASISAVTLQPKRLTAYMDISKQLLLQDAGSNAEAVLQANLIRAINEKFENTVLGSAQGSATQPAGLAYGVTPTSVSTWEDVCVLEAAVETAKGHVTAVIASPSAKAKFRALTYNDSTRLVYEDGMLEDVPCFSTPNVAADTFAVADWKYLAVGQWGGIDITVDPYTQAGNGAIRLVINVYMDAAWHTAATNVIKFGTF